MRLLLVGLWLLAATLSARADGGAFPGGPPKGGQIGSAASFPPSTGPAGALSGVFASQGAGPTSINLTTLTSGGTDYNTWTTSAPALNDQCDKATGGNAITATTAVGSGGSDGLNAGPFSYTFTDGATTPGGGSCIGGGSQSGNTDIHYFGGAASYGWSVTVPATTSTQIVTFYSGNLSGETETVTATLSDSSHSPYTDSSCTGGTGWVGCKHTITYNSASNGQTLTITGKTVGSGFIGLNAVTLVP